MGDYIYVQCDRDREAIENKQQFTHTHTHKQQAIQIMGGFMTL